MVFDDEKEEVIDEEGLPEAEEDEDDLKDKDEAIDMFGGEDPESTRDRDWM